ncbi:MAG TPA: hypothetical protein VMP67_01825, partial [Candidatus Limnocylindria bacterium]|nr:hypothetical protein [Candidatus Limnocylindria bacterium]
RALVHGLMRSVAVTLVLLVVLAGCVGPPQGGEIVIPAPTGEPAPPSGAPPEADPAAELERVMELRSDWGLRSDEEWIRQVTQDPGAVMSELGIPVTPEEAAELQEMRRDEPRTRLIMYGAREHEQFGGLWVNDAGFDVVMLFTADLDRHRQAVAALAPQMRVDIRPARFSEAELRALQRDLIEDLLAIQGMEFLSLGLDTINNVLHLEAKSNDPTLAEHLEAQYGGRLTATIHPLPGAWANVGAGDGWRLLADGRTSGAEAYRVRAATDAGEWEQMWADLDPVNPAPAADLETEIVVSFGHGVGSSCPELRLDDVVIDQRAAIVHSLVSDPLEPRGCTADLAGAVYFVVALERAALPESPFTLQLAQRDLGTDEDRLTIDLRP